MPAPNELQLTTEQRDDGIVLRVAGEIDLATAPLLSAAIDEALAGAPCCVVDLARVSFLDSTGAGALLTARRRAAADDKLVTVIAVEGAPRRMLELTGILERLN